MPADIRSRPSIDHTDVTALNFIRTQAPYLFRRHFRQGLRSHIMEILDPVDVAAEEKGTLVDGMRWFPKARPRRMLRIFRSRLKTLDEALAEIGRVKMVENYLAPEFMATSTECIVDYRGPDGHDLMLCGFQEYIDGEILDPWNILDADDLLPTIHDLLGGQTRLSVPSRDRWITTVRRTAARFIEKIKSMVVESGHIPDLAGAGNLMVTAAGGIHLVDINNISRVVFDSTIRLDEKGYPVGDKSVEALGLIEAKVLGKPIDMDQRVYRRFLDPARREAVKAKEDAFRDMNTR